MSTTPRGSMRVLITGSRFEDVDLVGVEVFVRGLPLDAVLVVGDCPTGVDAHARLSAALIGLSVEVFRADWAAHSRGAGPRRNQAMVDSGATFAMAWPGPRSRGTWDCVRRCRAARIPVRVMGVPEVYRRSWWGRFRWQLWQDTGAPCWRAA